MNRIRSVKNPPPPPRNQCVLPKKIPDLTKGNNHKEFEKKIIEKRE